MGRLKSLGRKIRRRLVVAGVAPQISYSQCGEDLIIAFLFELLRVPLPTYIDIGAHHPIYLNNTKLLYDRGSRGINVEANPRLFRRFTRQRRRDINLNIGIFERSDVGGVVPFYVMSVATMSTFSKEEAERLAGESSIQISEIISIRTQTLRSVIAACSGGNFPDLLTVDIEGLDASIVPVISSFALESRPKVICMETLTYDENRRPEKRLDLIDRVKAADYHVYADTFINTVFCRSDLAANVVAR